MKIKVDSKYIKEEVILQFAKYFNGATAIKGNLLNGEPAFVATVNLETEIPDKGKVFLKGWSENEGIPESLEKAGIVKLTGRTIPTGYVEAQEAILLVEI